MRCKACNNVIKYVVTNRKLDAGLEELCSVCRVESYGWYDVVDREHEHAMLTESPIDLDL